MVRNIIIVFFVFPAFLFAQDTEEESNYYNWFDQVIGQDHLGLHNGKQYVDRDKNVLFDNKHAYFKTTEFLKGSVVYDGQTYYDADMQYNLETDDLVVGLKSKERASVFKLIREKIDGFVIDGHRFVSINNFEEDNKVINGFQEIMLENTSFTLLKRHKKNRTKKIKQKGRRRHLYYAFLGSYSYGVLIDKVYTIIDSKSDVVKLFPTLKKEINNYYGKNWRLRKSQPDRFVKGLFETVITPSTLKKESL